MSEYEHLQDEVINALLLPSEDRANFAMQDRWIGYSRAHEAISLLKDTINQPKTLRMQNVLLVGESNNGKSSILREFCGEYPVVVKNDGNAYAPIVRMDMPSEPSESRFWSELLLSLQIPHNDRDPPQRKKNQAVSVLAMLETRMLVIDEIHNLLYGNVPAQRHFLAVLKNLTNELRIPIVAAGTVDAIRALHTDTQLSSRFEAFKLPRWKLNVEFRTLLTSFESVLPLAKPSKLDQEQLTRRLHSMSGMTIGGLAQTLKKAAVKAIRTGKERIDANILDSLTHVPLLEYGAQADRL